MIPCFNHEKFLLERINSILTQTVPVDEIIFLDDASTDGSVATATQLLDQLGPATGLQFRINKVNSGSVFKQWNLGVSLARNDFIWIAESDDTCDNTFLESCLAVLRETRCVLAYAKTCVIDSSSQLTSLDNEWANVFVPYIWADSFIADGPSFVRDYMSVRNVIPNASGVVFSKKAYISAGLAPEHLRMCGDWLLWGRVIMQGCVGYTTSSQNYFRRHHGNVHTSSHVDIVREHIEVQGALFSSMRLRSLRPTLWQRRQILKDLLERGLAEKTLHYWLTHLRLAALLCWLVGIRGIRIIAVS